MAGSRRSWLFSLEALKTADNYVKKWPNSGSDRFWLYKACALGQKYSYTQATEPTSPELEKIEAGALDAVRRGVAANDDLKEQIRSLLNPAPGSKENDLAPFGKKKDFIDAASDLPKQP